MTIDEINAILHECTAEVLIWPAWKRSDDVIRDFPNLYAPSYTRIQRPHHALNMRPHRTDRFVDLDRSKPSWPNTNVAVEKANRTSFDAS